MNLEKITRIGCIALGVLGIICPMINNRADAEEFVSACKYPPTGIRSNGPYRALMYGGNDYQAHANDEIVTLAMIETQEAMANLKEIVDTPGLDGVYIGPSDLALALGLPAYGDQPQEEHLETVKHILATCKKHGMVSGMHTSSLEYTKKYLELGFNMVMLGSDSAFMMRTASKELAEAKGSVEENKESTGY